ncbi:MAG: hypothetical protein JKY43_06605 [Phycisphaerales bacterium]|nr:hypothetical protein [Phycisphaerales bacterium]
MNTQKLIENTMLHTLGLLEDHEIQAYEAAFDAAPGSVQLLVREEARRMGDFGDLMPNNEPDPALRELVISAVRAAMREQDNEQRIASGLSSAPAVVGRIDPQSAQSARRAQPKISTTPRVHRLWRASTIGFAAATIALSVVWTNNNQTYNQVSPNAFLGQIYDTIGAEFLESTLFDSTTERVSMVSSNGSSNSMAAIWHNPDWDSARLFVKNMKASTENPYRLVVLDKNGEIVREVATFSSAGELENFEVQVNLKSERRLAIYRGINDAIESSEPLMSTVDSDL